MPCNTPAYILHAMQDLVDAAPRGRKGLAEDLGVSREVISYRLNGLQNWPLTDHGKVARYLGGLRGAQWLGLICGEQYGVYRRDPGQPSPAEIVAVEAAQIGAEGELLAEVHAALLDGRVELRELDKIVKRADRLESLVEELKAALRKAAGKDGGR